MDKMEMKEIMQGQVLEKKGILCNCCGRPLKSRNGLLMEDAFKAVKEWGYFSKKDLQVHSFTLCEECYDKITSLFQIPVTVSQKREVM